jgi:hypothetical protein
MYKIEILYDNGCDFDTRSQFILFRQLCKQLTSGSAKSVEPKK